LINLWDEYCDWLLGEVGFTNGHAFDGRRVPTGAGGYPDDYYILMEELHNIDFKFVIERDESRLKDGLALRYDFFDDYPNISGANFTKPCSVLEMLIGLAIRIDNEYIGDPGNPHPEYFFWDMIHNLGLDIYDNDHFNKENVREKVQIWMNREFKSDGTGSIFKLKNVTFDFRNVEIWQQAMAYLTENY